MEALGELFEEQNKDLFMSSKKKEKKTNKQTMYDLLQLLGMSSSKTSIDL